MACSDKGCEVCHPPTMCLRCGCKIQPGEPKAYGPSGYDPFQYEQSDRHMNVDHCMVALRRKEVEGRT